MLHLQRLPLGKGEAGRGSLRYAPEGRDGIPVRLERSVFHEGQVCRNGVGDECPTFAQSDRSTFLHWSQPIHDVVGYDTALEVANGCNHVFMFAATAGGRVRYD